MLRIKMLSSIAVSLLLTLSACSDGDDNKTATETSQFNPDLNGPSNQGEPGGDTSAIAGLWNGTVKSDEVDNVIYWHISSDGVLTQYDYQQDGVAGASGENCYFVGDKITLTPEDDSLYSVGDATASITKADDVLSMTFLEADKNDFNENGDTAETLMFAWPLLTTAVLSDLVNCDEGGEGSAMQDDTGTVGANSQLPGTAPAAGPSSPLVLGSNADRRALSGPECLAEGGKVIGDIGDGAIHEPAYRCESGLAPIGVIVAGEGEPIAVEGAVCCV